MANYKEKLRELVNESGFLMVDGLQSVPGGRKYIYYRKIGSIGQNYIFRRYLERGLLSHA